jgi:hypothetical protein
VFGTREEQKIAISGGDIVTAFRDVHLRIAGRHCTRFMIAPGCRLKLWDRFGGFSHELESIVMESGRGFNKDIDSSALVAGVGLVASGGGICLTGGVGSNALVAGGGLVASGRGICLMVGGGRSNAQDAKGGDLCGAGGNNSYARSGIVPGICGGSAPLFRCGEPGPLGGPVTNLAHLIAMHLPWTRAHLN